MVVTGGGTGIGAETARYFAEAGASRIALLGRREQPLLDTKASIEQKFAGVEVFVASTDVTKKNEVDAAFANFAGDREIHVLVDCAAIVGPKVLVRGMDGDKFVVAIQQMLKGSLFVAQACLRHASTDPVAINISSFSAHLNALPGFAAYSVAKLAVFRLWDYLVYENSEITVFHVQPGVIDTAMNREAGGIKSIGFADDSKCNDGLLSVIS